MHPLRHRFEKALHSAHAPRSRESHPAYLSEPHFMSVLSESASKARIFTDSILHKPLIYRLLTLSNSNRCFFDSLSSAVLEPSPWHVKWHNTWHNNYSVRSAGSLRRLTTTLPGPSNRGPQKKCEWHIKLRQPRCSQFLLCHDSVKMSPFGLNENVPIRAVLR